MADATLVQTALKSFTDQASAELVAAKADQASAAAALEASTMRVAKAEADILLGKGTADVMNGAAVVANAVTKAESDPATKYYAIGLVLLVAAAIVFGIAKMLGKI